LCVSVQIASRADLIENGLVAVANNPNTKFITKKGIMNREQDSNQQRPTGAGQQGGQQDRERERREGEKQGGGQQGGGQQGGGRQGGRQQGGGQQGGGRQGSGQSSGR